MLKPRALAAVAVAFFVVRALLPADVRRGFGGFIRTLALAIAIYLVIGLLMGAWRMLG